MTPKAKQTAIVLTAGVVLASAAFALGSQSGSGSANADAATSTYPRHPAGGFDGRPGGPRFGPAIADELGVDPATVREALEQLRPGPGTRPHRGPFGRENRQDRRAGLARAIGVSEARLEAAFRALRREFRAHRRPDRAAELADALNLSTEKVQQAFDQLRANHERRHDELAAALADRLNLDEAKVRAALEDARPCGRPHRHP